MESVLQVHENQKTKRMALSLAIRLGIIILGCLALLDVLVTLSVSSQIHSQYNELSTQIASVQSENMGRYLMENITDLRIFTDNPVCETGTDAEIVSWLEKNKSLTGSNFEFVFYAGRDGVGHLANGSTMDITGHSYFKAITQKRKWYYLSEPMYSSEFKKYRVYVARAVYDPAGATKGMFVGAISMDELQRITKKIKLGKGYAFVIDRSGLVISHPDSSKIMKQNLLNADAEGYTGYTNIVERMIAGETGSGEMTEPDGQKYDVVFTRVDKANGWNLGIVIPQSQTFSIARNIASSILFYSIIIIAILVIASSITVIRMIRPVKRVQATINDIATGDADLTRRIDIDRNDEIGLLVKGFNLFVDKLHSIISSVSKTKDLLTGTEGKLQLSIKDSSHASVQIVSNIKEIDAKIQNQSESVSHTASAVTEIARNLESLENMIQNQSAGVTQASSAVEEMISNISAVEQSTTKMAARFSDLAENAQVGIQKQENVHDSVESIAKQSATLMEANEVIASIASQTNLLAMNAAIEAAHAGDAGRGFSVVADEIRKLSETSSVQSRTIGDELKKIELAINSVVQSSNDSSQNFSSVASQIKDTDVLVREISNAMKEQQEGSRQIFESLQIMNDSTSEVRVASGEMTVGNRAILEEVNRLQESTQSIMASMSVISDNAAEISRVESELSTLSRDVADAVKHIGGEIDQFRI